MAISSPHPAALASPALAAYEELAPFYDDFTGGYAYDTWLGEIQALAAAHGVTGGRVLDVACGTGKSSEPLLHAGWEVWACDLSPAMVAHARTRLALDDQRCFVADMCQLPPIGQFDLVLCLDDSLNYLDGPGQLRAALTGFAAALAPAGLAVFDLNTLHTYQTVFASEFVRQGEMGRYQWRGLSQGPAQPDSHFMAQVGVEGAGEGLVWSEHRQRHFSHSTVKAAAAAGGLRILGCWGQSSGAQLHSQADEQLHSKVVYALGHSSGEEVQQMIVNP